MFGRKRKKVDLEELISELAGDEENEGTSGRKALVDGSNYRDVGGVRFKVEFEGVEELIKEIRALRESIDSLIEALREGKQTK
ncbi:hypothetical protein [Vulcanisaeta thermophila]|uniref:hypothetical protein n=1 Tax=Vulcanisaeta thermophila TaxID=867917 RepID=UPI000853BFAE|nr:hypothetical protein [Vulcanisaeta thermophila]